MTSSLSVRTVPMTVDHELLELVSALVCLIDDSGVTFINQAGVRMLGIRCAEDAIGFPFELFVVEDYRFLMDAGWELLAAEDFLPLKLKRADGSPFDAELRVRRLYEASDSFLIEVRDISKFVKSAEALRDREERLHGILRSVAEGIVSIGENGLIETTNPSAEAMFGYAPGKLVGHPLTDLLPESVRERHDRFVAAYFSGDFSRLMGRTVEGLGQRADGSLFPMEISVSELKHGRQRLFTAILRDISERKESEERIRRLAHHDALTGLPNRNLLNDRMGHALARVKRNGTRLAVLYVDLDRFKPINDTFGHEAGDQVLKEVARRLIGCVRSSDTVSRVGGDEFVVVIEEISQLSEAALVAGKIVDVLSRPIIVGTTDCAIGASLGVAVFPDDGLTPDEICKAADVAMYRVKHSGRNGYCFFAEGPPN